MSIEREDLPDQMNLSSLADRSMNEIRNYSRGEPYNDQYCLEIFHRAITQHDEQAWELFVRSFRGMMLAWLRSHPKRDIAFLFDSEQNYVDVAFARFWQATTRNQELVFTSVAVVLSYLKACLHGAILDAVRAYSRPVLPLPEPGSGSGYAEEPAAEDNDNGCELWEVIKSMLPGEREQRVAYLLIHCGLKPRKVIRYCPGEFSDVQEVYRLRRSILERLIQNADQIRWRLSDEEREQKGTIFPW